MRAPRTTRRQWERSRPQARRGQGSTRARTSTRPSRTGRRTASGTSSSSATAYHGICASISAPSANSATITPIDSVPSMPAATGRPVTAQTSSSAPADAATDTPDSRKPIDAEMNAAIPAARPRPNPATPARSPSSRNVTTLATIAAANAARPRPWSHICAPSRCDSTDRNTHAAATPATTASAYAAGRARDTSESTATPTSGASRQIRRILCKAFSGANEKPSDSTICVAYPATMANHAYRVRPSSAATASATTNGATPPWTAGCSRRAFTGRGSDRRPARGRPTPRASPDLVGRGNSVTDFPGPKGVARPGGRIAVARPGSGAACAF